MSECYRIVIIDSNPDDQERYRRMLSEVQAVKYKILNVRSENKGLDLIKSAEAHGILLDVSPLGQGGIPILKSIREEYPDLPVILLTDQSDEDVAAQVMREGAQDYMAKSEISAEALHTVIQLAIASAKQKKESTDMENKTIRLLIIDDNEDDRELCRRSLKKIKNTYYHIAEASDGDNGLELVDQFSPHCILLDYYMPGRNGIEILKCIRSRYTYIPVVMLTGQGDETVAVRVMKEGAQDYIRKSNINPESLHRIIKLSVEYCLLQKRVVEQHESLTLFTRALAHDLKEPVRMINSFVELIRKNQTLSEKNQVFFDFVVIAASNMERLIDMVQLYTQLDANRNAIEKEFVECKDVLDTVLVNLQKQISERQALIHADIPGEVFVNRVQLMQVFQNIIGNALSYCDKPEPEIHISCQYKPEYVVFSVRDNGSGINRSYGKQIFEPFKRFSTAHRGSGLGLAICKKIIEYHGGKIWYESVLGQGTTFKFTIPNRKPEKVSTLNSRKQKPGNKKNDGMENKALANVLLVEDSDPDIELARIILFEEDNLQFNLYTAANGEEALRFLQDKSNPVPDLILLDINMPVMGGFDFLKYIRNERTLAKLPVIICSTSTYDKDIEDAKKLGVAGYVNKPLTLKKIESQIQALKNVFLSPSKTGFELKKVVH